MTITTRAAVLRAIGAARPYADSRPLTVETVTLDPPGPGEVLVAIKAAGLCHSDLSVINGDRPRPLPMALGHEAAGVVEALGPDVTDLAVGDHVVMVFMPSCGHCNPCAEGRPALCEPGAVANGKGELLTGGKRIHHDGQALNHHLGCSAFADRAVVSRRSLVKVDPELPLDEAALFGCAVLTGVGAVVNTAGVRAGQSAVVVGLGGVGLASVLGALASGASPVVAVDLSEDKLALARTLGPGPDRQRRRSRRRRTGAQTHQRRRRFRVRDGRLGPGAGGGVEDDTAGRDHGHRRPAPARGGAGGQRRLAGGRGADAEGQLYRHGHPQRATSPATSALFREGRLPVDRLLTGVVALDDINAAFDDLHAGLVVRQIVTFEGG
jgi:alcohol dehydrogenase